MAIATQESTSEVLLREFGISLLDIADDAGVEPDMAKTALTPQCMESCPVIVLIKVQVSTETLLRQHGWRGDRNMLWREFNAVLSSMSGPQHRIELVKFAWERNRCRLRTKL